MYAILNHGSEMLVMSDLEAEHYRWLTTLETTPDGFHPIADRYAERLFKAHKRFKGTMFGGSIRALVESGLLDELYTDELYPHPQAI